MRKAFTLIELLVASLLLGMVVTILTMIFNQSSIAWRTGVGSVVNLNQSRQALGEFHDIRDDILPGLGQQNVSGGASDNRTLQYRTVSLWDADERNKLRTTRAFAEKDKGKDGFKWDNAWQFAIGHAKTAMANSPLSGGSPGGNIPHGANGGSSGGFSVGVRSWGPDGEPNTEDDINTWPGDEIDW